MLIEKADTAYKMANVLEIRKLTGYSTSLEAELGDIIALYHPLTAYLHVLTENQRALIEANALDNSDSPEFSELKKKHLLIPHHTKLQLSELKPPTTDLEVYVNLTTACNMSCVGCAVGIDHILPHQIRTADPEQLQIRFKHLFSAALAKGVKTIKIKWAGGEPLLAKPGKVIAQLQETVQKFIADHPDISVSQVVLTNGTRITQHTAQRLAEWNMRLSVSLWGVGKNNNLLRGVKHERDNYDQILAGLNILQNFGIPFNINHVITPDSTDTFAGILTAVWDVESDSYIAESWDTPPSRPIGVGITYLRPQNAEDLQFFIQQGYAKLVAATRKGFAVILDLLQRGITIPRLQKLDYLQPFSFSPATCGTGFSYVVIDDKTVQPCHERLPNATTVPIDTINPIAAANDVYTDAEKAMLVATNIAFPDSLSSAMIAALQLHGGAGCPHSNTIEHGRLGVAGNIAISLYAHILPEFLALRAQQMLLESSKPA